MSASVGPIPNKVSSSSEIKERVYPFGKFIYHTVSWLRAESDSAVQEVIKKIMIITAAVLLSITLIGVPLLVLTALEWSRQDNRREESPRHPSPDKLKKQEIDEIIELFTFKNPEPLSVKPPEPVSVNPPEPVSVKPPEKLDAAVKVVEVEKVEELKPCTLLYQSIAQETEKYLAEESYLENGKDVIQRFIDIPCIAKTAVKMDGATPPYLHANLVEFKKEDMPQALQDGLKNGTLLKTTVTQAPIGIKENIGADTRGHFWREVLKQGSVIIDLTKPIDLVSKYCPEEIHKPWTDIGKMEFGKISVKTIEITEMKYGIKVYKCLVQDGLHGKPKMRIRIHFPDWTDKEGLDKIDLVKILYLYELEKKLCAEKDVSSIVHCRAGVGRTGTYTVAKALIEIHQAGLLTKDNAHEIIKALILSGRKQRGPAFVQSEKQLQTLLDLSEYLLNKNTVPSETKTVVTPHSDEALDQLFEMAKNGMNTDQDIEKLDQVVTDLKEQLLDSQLSAIQKSALHSTLGAIKTQASHSWGQGYVNISTSTKTSQALPESLKAKINWIMNAIQSKVPDHVKSHPAFRPEIIHSKNVFESAGMILVHNYQSLVIQKKDPGAVYLFRDSSSRSGPENIQAFTLSFCALNKEAEMEIKNIRLAFNGKTNRWQLANPLGEQNKKEPVYDLNSSSIIVTKHQTDKLVVLQEWFPKEYLTFDQEGNLLNSFPTLEALALVMISYFTMMHPNTFFPVTQ